MSAEKAPMVSVIVPVYNAEKYIRQCADSILTQTRKDFELLFVDDGSTDSSPEILREYAGADPRITVIRKEHSNAGAARNLGLDSARGEYLLFLDADDFFEPVMLEGAVARAEQTRADVVVFNARRWNEGKGKPEPHAGYLRMNVVGRRRVFRMRDLPTGGEVFTCATADCWKGTTRADACCMKSARRWRRC